MWSRRYRIYKTDNPQLIITAVQSYPNMINTLDKAVKFFKTNELQSDSKLLEIVSLHGLLRSGCNFTVLHLADTCPKLNNLKNVGDSWFWCIGYINPAYNVEYRSLNSTISKINEPSHARYYELLEYSINNLDGKYCQFLFDRCIINYISEQTRHFTDEDNHIKYRLGTRVSYDWSEDKICKEGLQFIDNMYLRNIYELMFNTLTK